MNAIIKFLNFKTSWTNTEVGLLKICLVSLGIVAGVVLHKVLKDYILLFAATFLITGLWTFVLWIKKMRNE